MGLMDRIKKVAGTGENAGYDDSYEDDYYQGFDGGYDDNPMDDDMQVAGGGMNMGNTQQIGSMTAGGGGPQMPGGGGSGGSQMPINNGGSIGLSGASVNMKVVRPKNYDGDTASQIANHLLNKCTVILNLEQTNKETSRRLIDFLTGVAYSIGGTLKKITDKTYVVTPANVDVDDAKIKPTARRNEAPQEPKEEPANEDFTDFN